MLDKSVPYLNMIFVRQPGMPVPEAILPEGYTFRWYTAGMEADWAEIVTSVGEFDTTEEAFQCFLADYLPYKPELESRMLFAVSPEGCVAGTFTIWWDGTEGRRVPSVHWVAVRPEEQGRGIGKALVFRGIQLALELEGDCEMMLHTQSWSYKAVGIYLEAGFRLSPDRKLATYPND